MKNIFQYKSILRGTQFRYYSTKVPNISETENQQNQNIGTESRVNNFIDSLNIVFDRLTGYNVVKEQQTKVENLELQLTNLDRKFKNAQIKTIDIQRQLTNMSKEVVKMNSTRHQWTDQDAIKAMQIFKQEGELETSLSESDIGGKQIEQELNSARTTWHSCVRDRYSIELLYQDKVRMLQNYVQVAFLVANFSWIFTYQFVVEPKRRKLITQAVGQQVEQIQQDLDTKLEVQTNLISQIGTANDVQLQGQQLLDNQSRDITDSKGQTSQQEGQQNMERGITQQVMDDDEVLFERFQEYAKKAANLFYKNLRPCLDMVWAGCAVALFVSLYNK